MASSSSVEAQL